MKPIIALSMGDPAGIGPEIIIKALAKREIAETAAVIVAGDPQWNFRGCPGFRSTVWKNRPREIFGPAFSM